MVSKRFYVYAGEAITPLGLLRHGLIATRAPPCPLGQLVGFSPPRFSGPSRRGEGSPAEGRRSRPAAEPQAPCPWTSLAYLPDCFAKLVARSGRLAARLPPEGVPQHPYSRRNESRSAGPAAATKNRYFG